MFTEGMFYTTAVVVSENKPETVTKKREKMGDKLHISIRHLQHLFMSILK